MLRHSLVYGDGNDYNIKACGDEITGIFDFGDMGWTVTASDIAIVLTYVMFQKSEPIQTAKEVLKAYDRVFRLEEVEVTLLPYLILARCCQSVLMSAFTKS